MKIHALDKTCAEALDLTRKRNSAMKPKPKKKPPMLYEVPTSTRKQHIFATNKVCTARQSMRHVVTSYTERDQHPDAAVLPCTIPSNNHAVVIRSLILMFRAAVTQKPLIEIRKLAAEVLLSTFLTKTSSTALQESFAVFQKSLFSEHVTNLGPLRWVSIASRVTIVNVVSVELKKFVFAGTIVIVCGTNIARLVCTRRTAA